MAKIGAFRFWCQKVLPLVYDDSISYYELLNKMVVYLNNVISDFNTVAENFDNLDDAFDTLQGSFNDTKNAMLSAYDQLQSYVNNYFDNLDVQEEINNKLDEMAEDGSLTALLQPFIENQISTDVTAWLQAHITPTSPAVDSSLTVSGAAADAKVTGDKIEDLKADLGSHKQNLKFYINKNKWTKTDFIISAIISVNGGEKLIITGGSAIGHYAGLTSVDGIVADGTPSYSSVSGWTSERTVGPGGTQDTTIPDDVKYIYVFYGSNNNALPDSLNINGYDYIASLTDNVLMIHESLNSLSEETIAHTEDIDGNFEEISKINGNLVKQSDFELGNITIGTGGWTYNDMNYRVRTKQGVTIPLKAGDTVSLDDYTKARFYLGCRANNVYTMYGWLTSDFTVTVSGDYVVLLDAIPASVQNDKTALLSRLSIIHSTNSLALAIDWDKTVKAINHRGYNVIAPENTLPAFKLSKKMGFNYVECDVQLTSDRVPVILHDSTINRTARNTDGTTISSTINIADITYEQANSYDYGIWKGSNYAGTKIPTFTEFITLCRNLGLKPYVEIKENVDFTEAEIKALCDIVRSSGMTDKVSWICGNLTFLEYIRDYVPTARLGYVKTTMYSEYLTEVLTLKTNTNEIFLDIHSVTDELLNGIILNNVPVEYWTVNTSSEILALNKYVTGVTSDNLIAGKILFNNYIT